MSGELWILLRLLIAGILGGIIGYEREWTGKRAGLRTHMLVTMGAALFVSFNGVALEQSRQVSFDASPQNLQLQVAVLVPVQGVATGIGFLGAGTIFLGGRRHQVHGLTTAASIWLMAAIGVAVAFDKFLLAAGATLMAFIVLHVLRRLEPQRHAESEPDQVPPAP